MRPNFKDFDEFWLFYLCEHSSPTNRWLHFMGTSLALLLLVVALSMRNWQLLIAVPVCGYALAWVGHFFVERNRPASFSYPGWSFRGDMKMWACMLSGRLADELQRASAKSEMGHATNSSATP